MTNNKKSDDNKKNKPIILDDSFSEKTIERMKKQKRMTQKEIEKLVKMLNTLYYDNK